MADNHIKPIYVFSELDDSVLLPVIETADLFGVTTAALRNWVHRGVGPKPIRVGGVVRFSVGSIRQYLHERTKAAEAAAEKAAMVAGRVGRPRWSESDEAQEADAA